jgi:serine/threonine protein kinase
MVGRLPQMFVNLIVLQIAWILRDMHAEGYIYRDIKLSNFIVHRMGVVTIIDLGKAKRIGSQRTLTICGTVHAIPPEVLLGGGTYPYSYEFDYYQLGVLLYEMVVGQPPFGYENTNPKIKEGIEPNNADIRKGIDETHLKLAKHEPTANLIR